MKALKWMQRNWINFTSLQRLKFLNMSLTLMRWWMNFQNFLAMTLWCFSPPCFQMVILAEAKGWLGGIAHPETATSVYFPEKAWTCWQKGMVWITETLIKVHIWCSRKCRPGRQLNSHKKNKVNYAPICAWLYQSLPTHPHWPMPRGLQNIEHKQLSCTLTVPSSVTRRDS